MKGNFSEIINSDTPVLVDFHATWCAPCKTQTPILQELAKENTGKLKVIKIDVDKNQALAQKYNVQGVPTLIMFKNGDVCWQQSGVTPKNVLESVLNQYCN